jgi:hypothetical protein
MAASLRSIGRTEHSGRAENMAGYRDDKNAGKPKKPKPAAPEPGAPADDEDVDEGQEETKKKKYAPISVWDKIVARLNARSLILRDRHRARGLK